MIHGTLTDKHKPKSTGTAGMTVIKADGRTTRTARGTVNGIMGDCRVGCALIKGTPVFSSREWVALSSRGAEPLSAAGDSGSFFVTQEPPLEQAKVVGMVFAGARVSWPQTLQGDGSVVPPDVQGEGKKLYYHTELEDNPLYGAEITIITPATSILKWLSQDIGGDFEFGDPL